MVHCGGYVSDQYLQVCEAAGYKFVSRPAVGERLDIGADYFIRAAGVVARVAFMLTHTLWQKVLPSEANEAHDCLNEQIYRFLCAKRWKMAADMGAFSLSEPMLAQATDLQHRIRLCNTAIALKNLKKQDEMKALLSSVDWTASIRDFRLAVAILDDKLEDAAMLMRQIGKRGELVHEIAYHQWPLFGSFRETKAFHKAYEDVYGYPFYVRAERSAEEAMSRLDKSADAALASTDRPEIEEPRKRRTAKRRRTSCASYDLI
jgi:hypothetical protein